MKKLLLLVLVLVFVFTLGCNSKNTPSTSQQEKVPIKAVYLVSKQGGELSQKDLEAHPEVLDYFIKMLYKKFQEPMTEEDANNINTVKDYALAIYFNGQDGIKEYHEQQKESINYAIENWNASLTKEELIKVTKSMKRM